MRLVSVLLVILFFISGCSNVKTYTFKKDRVDQKMEEGNRGYLKGTPPPAESRVGLKRTIIGVDIETPFTSGGKEGRIVEEKKTILEIPPRQIKGEIVEEEEWIK